MADDKLCVGDVVCLYSAEAHGYVFSSQSSSVHNKLAVGSQQHKKRPDVKDQNLLAFEICIANRYKLNKKFRSLKDKIDQDPENYLLRSQLHQSELAAKAETDDNQMEQKRQHGKKLLYGQIIQLKHRFTLKYVHVSKTVTSSTESNNMAVELQEFDAKHAQFKVMPRYKVKAEGDVVQVDDEIVFESVKSMGQYLHVSTKMFSDVSIYQDSYELNLSVQQSGFTVFRKYKPSPDDEKKVKVGDIVRFYHKEMEAYLVAEGLFDDELTEDVHLRIRPVDQSIPKTLLPSSSAITYWQVQHREGLVTGGVLKWQQQCRLLHMCTRKYLCVEKGGKVSLTSDYLDPCTVFRLHPVIRESDDIPEDSYCRMDHVVSGQWLHALTDEYERTHDEETSDGNSKKSEGKSKKSDAKSMSSLKWSTAQLRKIGSVEEKQYDDAFTIQAVDQSLEKIFNFMAGMVPFIQKLVRDKKAGVILNARMFYKVDQALREMTEFMVVDGEPVKQRQKLMRNLRIVELLVSLLKCRFTGLDQHHMTRIFTRAFDVLYKYLKGNSRKNELYIAKYINFFLTMFEIKEVQNMSELQSDTSDSDINEESGDLLLGAIRLTKLNADVGDTSSTILQFLQTNLQYMAEDENNIAETTSLNTELKVHTDQGKIGLHAAHLVMGLIGDNRKIVDRITHENIDKFVDLLRQEKNYRYLDLLSVLCVCNGVSIANNQNYITEVWLRKGRNCIFHTDLQKTGLVEGSVYVSTNNKQSYVDLHVFADRDKEDEEYLFLKQQLKLFRSLCYGQNTHSINVITQELGFLTWEEAFTCLSDDRLPHELRALYCDLIITMFVDVADNNSIVDRVKLSYIYDEVDNEENQTDKRQSLTYQYFPQISQWVFDFLGRNSYMTASLIGNNMLVKQVLRLVHYLVLFGYYKSDDIKKLLEPLMNLLDGRDDRPYPNIEGMEAEEILQAFQKCDRFKPSPETKAIVEAKCQALDVLDLFFNLIFNIQLEKFINLFKVTNMNMHNFVQEEELAPLMFETFDLKHNAGAAEAGMSKLKEIFDITSLLQGYDTVAILLDLSHYEYDDMVRKSMHLLNRYFSAHQNLFSRAIQAQVLITDNSVKVFRDLEEKLPVLRRLSSNKISDTEAEKLIEILDTLIHYCHLNGEEEEPHAMNQSILYNDGLVEDAFNILSQEFDVKLQDQYEGVCKVFARTFILLKRLARENPVVQERLFDRLDILLSKEGAPQEMAEALIEVFTGNFKTSMKINQHQVRKIMELVVEHKTAAPQFLDLLNALSKVQDLDLPLKHNQGLVMTYFMQFRGVVATILDQDEKRRDAILISSDTADLRFLISMVDLLATCAEGENRFIESICQTIFKIPELLRVLNNANISDNLKRPFLRFFVLVYMETARGSLESWAEDVQHSPLMWEYLSRVSDTLVSAAEHCKQDPATVKYLLRKPPEKSERCKDKPENIRGTLHYLFDAVMPFLQIFCQRFFQIDTELYPEEHRQMVAIANNFKNFMEKAFPLISLQPHIPNLVSCMSALFSMDTEFKQYVEDFQGTYGHMVTERDVKSNSRMGYTEYYKEEDEINKQLEVFIDNMRIAYGGVNDVQTQIGYPSGVPYSEIGGDEDLPLGAEFQEHINSFIDEMADSSVERYRLAEKLIKQLKISTTLTNLSEKERLEQRELDIKCMQLLRGLIHNEIVKLPEDFENDINSCKKQLKVIEDVQKALNHIGSIEGILEHLIWSSDEVVKELLAFLAALLFNGNDEVQGSLFRFFSDSREEMLLLKLKEKFTLSELSIRDRRVLQDMQQIKIEEAIAQANVLKKTMRSADISNTAIQSIQKSLLNSMTSLKKTISTVMVAKPSSKSLYHSVTTQTSNYSIITNVLNKTEVKGEPNSLEMKKMSHSKLSHLGSSELNTDNDNVPKIIIENVDDKEFEKMLTEAAAMKDFEFKDDGHIELVLRILGLMCDNQHEGLQNYLREQPDHIKSVNLVAETTKFLNILYSNINANSIALIIQVFETLTEFTSGNSTNQAVVFDNKICDYVNHILRVGDYKDCELHQVYSFKRAIGVLIRCLTEENSKSTEKQGINLPKEVMEYLDSGVLVATMTEAYTAHKSKADEELGVLLQNVGFQYYHLVARSLDLIPCLTREAILKTEEQVAAFDCYANSTLSIEIIKNNAIQKIYFQVKDKKVLREEIIEKFKYEVDRSSPSNKLRDFMDWSSDIIKDIKYQRRVYANPFGKMLVNYWLPLNYAVMFITIVIALVIFMVWQDDETTGSFYKPGYSIKNGHVVIHLLGGIHNFLSLGIFFSYIISNRPTFPTFPEILDAFRAFSLHEPILFNVLTSYFRREVDEVENNDRSWNDKEGESHLEVKAYGFKTLYYVVFLGCSFAGTVTDGYFFAFHLLHITELNQMLKRVIQAVTTNGKSLLLVALLGLVIFYIYALILFAFYRNWMWSAVDGHHCRTIYECFVSILHHGLSESPYTVNTMFAMKTSLLVEQFIVWRNRVPSLYQVLFAERNTQSFYANMGPSFTEVVGIAFYDVSFFIIITTIGLNIIFGIIVDTFSELRDSKWEIDKDMQNICFICSKESYDFERQVGGFQRHVKEEHNIWAYLFFFIHLDETRPNDYSALELYVYKLLMDNNFDFFPLHRALSLESEEDTKEQKLEHLQQQIDFLVSKIKEQEAELQREKEKARQLDWEKTHIAKSKESKK